MKHKLEHSNTWIYNTHTPDQCVSDKSCSIHNMSDHSMRSFPQYWRGDRGIMERICPHGIGHLDPDNYEYILATRGPDAARMESIHGCDGCCGSRP
jgi:hypothetical protein